MLSSRRGRVLLAAARQVERSGVPGAIVDCGVWNGGSSVLLSRGAPSRQVWAFDSFEGLPRPTLWDGSDSAGWEGAYRGSEQTVAEGFRRYGHPERLRIVKGWFEDTFPGVVDEVGPIALLHVDADWYESVKLALNTFYPSLCPGGFVLIDDYTSWAGAKRATDEIRDVFAVTAPLVDRHYWRK
jgi:O-methyltransferase